MEIRAAVKTNHRLILNKVLQNIFGVQWYANNDTIHRDHKVKCVREEIRDTFANYFNVFENTETIGFKEAYEGPPLRVQKDQAFRLVPQLLSTNR